MDLQFVQSPGGFNYDHCNWLICLNAKARRTDLSFDHLLSLAAKRSPDMSEAHPGDPIWEAAAREVYSEHENNLFDWAIEDARRTFTGREGKHYKSPDDDGWNALYDGTPVDVEFAFLGRSGGWLVLTHFDGYELSGSGDVLAEMPFATLRRLYSYLVMLRADMANDSASERVEEAATWTLFVNLCGDKLPTTPAVEKEAAERAHWEARDTVTA